MTCHICSKECSGFVDEKTTIVYGYCKTCQYIFKSSEHHQDFSTQKERYNLHENDENDEGYQAYFKRFLDFTLPLVGQPKRALDFGCGRSSLLASLLEKEGVNCDYYDPIYHPNTLDAT
ncbi:MAG: class I SAM-dependent methyltransferase, partial [Sulfurovum sp.]